MTSSPPLSKRAEAAAELLRRREARGSLHAFTRYTYNALYPQGGFVDGWHLRLMCRHLEAVERGDINRLMIFAPPRHLKSETVSRRFPAWALGRNPGRRIIATSYSADLANRISTDVQRIIDSDAYRRIFPGTLLNTRNIRSVAGAPKRTVELWETLNHGGAYRAAGAGGGITGMGGDILILDDPFKDRAEANSPTYREARWDWYASTFLTRLQKGGAIICVFTRWHEDDIGGRLLSRPGAEDWTVVNLPALAEGDLHPDDPRQPGAALWPAFKTREELLQLQATIGEYEFASLYQQRPSPKGGGLFKADLLDIVDVAPAGLKAVRRWDTASTEGGGDYSVGVKMAGPDTTGCYYILDVVRVQHEPAARDAKIKATSQADGPQVRQVIAIDHNDQKPQFARLLAGLQLEMLRDVGAKDVRAMPFVAQVNAGMVKMVRASWNAAFRDELALFPAGRHDDQVDAAAGAFTALTAAKVGPGIITFW